MRQAQSEPIICIWEGARPNMAFRQMRLGGRGILNLIKAEQSSATDEFCALLAHEGIKACGVGS